ncbi:MAG: hypothetical protein WC269_02220, partial [Candidatus Gracilibacteria bacterium]
KDANELAKAVKEELTYAIESRAKHGTYFKDLDTYATKQYQLNPVLADVWKNKKWDALFVNLKDTTPVVENLKKLGLANDYNAGKNLAQIIQGFLKSNKDIDLDDLLAACPKDTWESGIGNEGGRFVERFNKAKALAFGPDISKQADAKKELEKLYEIYINGIEILETLETLSPEKQKFSTYSQSNREILESADKTEKTANKYFKIDDLITRTDDVTKEYDLEEVKENGIGISTEVLSNLQSKFPEYINSDLAGLKLIFTFYKPGELIASGNIKQNGTNLILESLPEKFSNPNVIEAINNYLKEPDAEEKVRKLHRLNEKLETTAGYEIAVEDLVRSMIKRAKELAKGEKGTAEANWLDRMRGFFQRMRFEGETDSFWKREVVSQMSGKETLTGNDRKVYLNELEGSLPGLVRKFLDRQKVTADTPKGPKEFTIYTYVKGEKIYKADPENGIAGFFKFMLESGEQQMQENKALKDYKSTPDLILMEDLKLKTDGTGIEYLNSIKDDPKATELLIAGDNLQSAREEARQQEGLNEEKMEYSEHPEIRKLQKILYNDGKGQLKKEEFRSMERMMLSVDTSTIEMKVKDASKMSKVERDVAASMGISYDQETGKWGVGIGAPIPITEKLSIRPVVGTNGVQGGIGYMLVDGKHFGLDLSAGTGVGIAGGAGLPLGLGADWSGAMYYSLGATPSLKIPELSEHFKISVPFGACISAQGPGVYAGLNLQIYDSGTKVEKLYDEERESFKQVDEKETIKEKVEAIKELAKASPSPFPPKFNEILKSTLASIENNLGYKNEEKEAVSNRAIIMLYNAWRNRDLDKAYKDEEKDIRNFFSSIGCIYTQNANGTFTISPSLGIAIGDYFYTIPHKNVQDKLANSYSNAEMNRLLAASKSTEAGVIKAPEMYVDKNGMLRTMKSEQTSIDGFADRELLNAKLKEVGMKASTEEVEIDGKPTVKMELQMGVMDHKNIDMYIDPDSNLEITMTTDDKIIVSGKSQDLSKLVITKETMQLPMEISDPNAATAQEIIVLSTRKDFDRAKVAQLSREKFSKKWMRPVDETGNLLENENGQLMKPSSTMWRNERAAGTSMTADRMASTPEGLKNKEGFKDTLFGTLDY